MIDKMRQLSTSKQKIKQPQYSFSNLANTTHGESTKKNIETEQIHAYQPESLRQNNNKYSFSLPYSVQISQVVSMLTNIFSEDILHVEEDHHGGKLLINGIKQANKAKKAFANMVDCLSMFCNMYGLRGGSVYDTFNVVSISIKKQILNNRCLISIEHIQQSAKNHDTFLSQIIYTIQQQLKKIDTNYDFLISEGPMPTRYLGTGSLFVNQLQIKQKVHRIFIDLNDKRWTRFWGLFKKAQDTIQQKISKFKQNQNTTQDCFKKNKNKNRKGSVNTTTPSELIQALIFQSQSLYRALEFYYQNQVTDQELLIHYLNPLMTTTDQKEITLYSIQTLLSLTCFSQIIECYRLESQNQCRQFNKNAQQINQKYKNQQCFNYLELKKKYRLQELKKPYHPSIQLLKNISNSLSPRQLLLAVQKVFSSAKIDCLKSTKGKIQLCSMDELLPVMIFISARAQVTDYPVYVKIIEDYVKFKNTFQLEERVITTLYVAVEDIAKKWNI